MAVEKVGSCSSDLTPSLGISICHRCGCKKEKKKKKNLQENWIINEFQVKTRYVCLPIRRLLRTTTGGTEGIKE